MKCKDCLFWNQAKDEASAYSRNGRCRRYPPGVASNLTDMHRSIKDTIWPETNEDDWCGEWKVKEMVE